MEQKLKEAAELAGRTLGLSPRFIAAWWISENGWEWPSNNNVGNISYQGSGVPSGGVFAGVERVEPNRVCVYGTQAEGVQAFCHLLETPKADKALTLDLSDLKKCGEDIHKMCQLVGLSNWASSHYDPEKKGPGSLIWEVYQSGHLTEVFPEEKAKEKVAKNPVAGKPSLHQKIIIQKGKTLSRIALDHRTTVRALQFLNGIDNPNHIVAGDALILPLVYQVKSGDNLTKVSKKYGTSVLTIARMNNINPNHIEVGWHLFV